MSAGSNPWVCIIGRGRDGKREACAAVIRRLQLRGLSVGGALSEPVVDGERTGYDLVDVHTGERTELARQSSDPDVCDLSFDWGAFERARAWAARPGLDVVLLELGRLEAGGRGHWPALVDTLSADPPRVALLCIRPDRLTEIALQLSDPIAYLELPPDDDALDRFAGAIGALARPS